MKLTTKGRYAVTAMIDLAMNQSVGPVSLKSISDSQGISLSYLEQLFSKMKRNDLVVGSRGPGGGYVLARDTHRISIADIILAVDEPLDITECEGEQNCNDGRRCLSHDLWSDLSDQLHAFLAGIHLGELMERSGIGENRQFDATHSETSKLTRQDGQRVAVPEKF
ncbi:MAG: Rrf2 family transcriptional regulator [Acidiferrobacterales bacterium]|nr:Rrf2 family transcriptional regulator [Acidiferrobacterales bacterium]